VKAKRIKQPSSRTCFMCGKQNEYGLKMEWYNNPQTNQIEAEVTIPDHFNGYPGVAHGGIIAAILDETASRAVMIDGDFENLFVTLKLEVTYRKITPTNTPLFITGWISKGSSKRKKVAAEIKLADGTVTAECQALVTRPPKQVAETWEPEKQYWKVY
jgi:acyl-coenzyme A thioesterase PaaI-like protein